MKDGAVHNNPFCIIDYKDNWTDSVIKVDKNEFGVGVNFVPTDPDPSKPKPPIVGGPPYGLFEPTPTPCCGGAGFAIMEEEKDIIL